MTRTDPAIPIPPWYEPDDPTLRALILPALLALILTAAIWMPVARYAAGPAEAARDHLQPPDDQHPPKKHPLTLGSDDKPTPTIAWISHKDFQKMLARKSKTRQPALQDKVKPVKHAPPRLKPTPPAPNVKRSPPKALTHAPVLPHPAAPAAASADGLHFEPEQGPAPFADAHHAQPGQHKAQSAKRDTPHATAHHPPRKPRAAANKQPAAPAARNTQAAKPTSAAKSKSEAALANFTSDTHKVEPGQVLTGPGIKIITKQPQFSAVTLASSLPINPNADITFNRKGRVIDVTLTRSSTFPNVDSAVERCLYRWRATGKALNRVHGPFILHIHLLLMDE